MSKLYDQLRNAARARLEGNAPREGQTPALLAQALKRAQAERAKAQAQEQVKEAAAQERDDRDAAQALDDRANADTLAAQRSRVRATEAQAIERAAQARAKAAEEAARQREEADGAAERARAEHSLGKLPGGSRLGFAKGAALAVLGALAVIGVQRMTATKDSPPIPARAQAEGLRLERTLDLSRTGASGRSSLPGPAPSR